mmetsp:Transcript_1882/g.3425  ORF Transcript_1882/g.3425 Transcript_1882/m.3425 type:complete len:88 (-) Transcript_1882:5-268(-)
MQWRLNNLAAVAYSAAAGAGGGGGSGSLAACFVVKSFSYKLMPCCVAVLPVEVSSVSCVMYLIDLLIVLIYLYFVCILHLFCNRFVV